MRTWTSNVRSLRSPLLLLVVVLLCGVTAGCSNTDNPIEGVVYDTAIKKAEKLCSTNEGVLSIRTKGSPWKYARSAASPISVFQHMVIQCNNKALFKLKHQKVLDK